MSLMIIHTFIKRQDCFTHICHILNCKICKRCIVHSSPVILLWNFCIVSMCCLSRVEPIPTHFALFNPCFVCWHSSSHQNVFWAFMFSVGDNQSFCEYFTVLQVFFLSPVNVHIWSLLHYQVVCKNNDKGTHCSLSFNCILFKEWFSRNYNDLTETTVEVLLLNPLTTQFTRPSLCFFRWTNAFHLGRKLLLHCMGWQLCGERYCCL